MPFPAELLHGSEEIVTDQSPHWWFLVPRGLALAGVLILGVVVAGADLPQAVNILMAVLIVVTLAWFLIHLATWRTTSFTVTTERCIYRGGLIRKEGIEIPLDRINTVRFNQSVFERVIGSGDLTIESASENGTQTFADIDKPTRLHRIVYEQMEANQLRDAQRLGRSVADAHAASAPRLTIEEQLEKLGELRDRGVLTDAEFQTRKAQILGQ